MSSLNRAAPLFDQELAVVFEHGGNSSHQTLIFRVLTSNATSPSNYYLEVTKEQDVTFLFHYDMTEARFMDFKGETKATFDFSNYFSTLVDHFRRCLGNDQVKINSETDYASQTIKFEADRTNEAFKLKYYLKLSLIDTEQGAILSVIQEGMGGVVPIFKLNLFRGTAEATNNYLGARLALTVQQLADCKAKVAELTHELTETEETKEQVTGNLEDLRTTFKLQLSKQVNDSEAATNKMVFDHQQRIEEVKLEHEQLVAKLRLEHERNAKTAAAQLAKHVEAIEVLNQSKFQLESVGKEMSLQLSSVRSDYTRVEAEVHKLRDENVKLGQNLHTSEKLVVGLQRDCERKDSEVASLEKTNAGLTQRVAVLESDIDDRKMQIKTGSGFIDEQRGKVAAARAECARLNEVIAGLQAEIQTLKDGHQRKNDVMKNMDAALKEGERRFKELDLQLDESKRAATDAQIEVKKLVAELDLQRVEISTMREEKINQKNVVDYLSKQNDEFQLPMGARSQGNLSLPVAFSPGRDDGGHQDYTAYSNISGADEFLARTASLAATATPNYSAHAGRSVVTPLSQQSTASYNHRPSVPVTPFMAQENMAPGLLTAHRHQYPHSHLQQEFDYDAVIEEMEPRLTSALRPEVQMHVRGAKSHPLSRMTEEEEPSLSGMEYYNVKPVSVTTTHQAHSSRSKMSDASPPAKTARTVTPPQQQQQQSASKASTGPRVISGPQGSLYDNNGRRVVHAVTPASAVRESNEKLSFRGVQRDGVSTSLLLGEEQDSRRFEPQVRSFSKNFEQSLQDSGTYNLTSRVETTHHKYAWQRDSFADK